MYTRNRKCRTHQRRPLKFSVPALLSEKKSRQNTRFPLHRPGDIPVRVSRFNTIFTSALLSSVIPGVLKRHGLITSSSSVSKTSIPVSSFSSLFAVTSNGSSSTLSAGSSVPPGHSAKIVLPDTGIHDSAGAWAHRWMDSRS